MEQTALTPAFKKHSLLLNKNVIVKFIPLKNLKGGAGNRNSETTTFTITTGVSSNLC